MARSLLSEYPVWRHPGTGKLLGICVEAGETKLAYYPPKSVEEKYRLCPIKTTLADKKKWANEKTYNLHFARILLRNYKVSLTFTRNFFILGLKLTIIKNILVRCFHFSVLSDFVRR